MGKRSRIFGLFVPKARCNYVEGSKTFQRRLGGRGKSGEEKPQGKKDKLNKICPSRHFQIEISQEETDSNSGFSLELSRKFCGREQFHRKFVFFPLSLILFPLHLAVSLKRLLFRRR